MENRAILREWFDRVDSHKTGNITATQLKSALAAGNLHFATSVVQQMVRLEFVELNKFLLKVQQAFSGLERGRGFLVPDEAYEALVKIGFSLDSPAFYTVCESFDESRSGKLRLDEFISLCIFVQSSRSLQIAEYEGPVLSYSSIITLTTMVVADGMQLLYWF
ncbi:sorcin [Phtheirospermum japonicum]|uniref:Sorcin n=1 Tax=Phtheirospermum japonicum TaxID=374723 RepID=A0A830D0C7_9LAMI|nr:sorcin [Phtheirospermum japonicum]